MSWSLSVIFLLAIPFTSALDILLPLYIYPGEGASAWSDVFSTISSHPNVQFEVVVNPNSGPGTTSFPTDPNIITGVSKLNSFPNVHTVGYVLTGWGSRDNTTVEAEVDVYASWAQYGDADIHIGGIYFDEVGIDIQNHPEIIPHYQSLSEHARSAIPSAHITFNPGYRAPEQLFAFCDTMVEFEHPLADYEAEGILAQIPDKFADKSAVQIIDTPEGTELGGLIAEMKQKNLKAVFFGVDEYKQWSKELLTNMADAV
ncbi:MAG: hypothetical protein Q9186_003819 [Xanthomendoza sp. 1 TL-2023]